MKDSAVISIKMGLHVGNTLKYVTGLYPTLHKVILELIQNSLDSGANMIRVNLDYKQRTLTVRDNGSGITPAKFREAISLVCSSMKDNSKLGQFGIGMMSPLGKCKGFVITSAARAEQHHYHRWIFDSERIISSPELPEIPVIPIDNLFFSYSGQGGTKGREAVDWRTEVNLESFSKDRSINTIQIGELKNSILGQFSESMRRYNTTVFITVKEADSPSKISISFKAATFNGEQLGLLSYGDSGSGVTLFDIYLSPKTKAGRKGQLVVGIEGNDFRIPLPLFLKSAAQEISPEISHILLSGLFEGSIISSNCTLHPNRKEFLEDEARMNFLIHLESWVKNHGQKHLVAVKDGEKDTWLQAVGSMAISQLEERLKHQMPHLLEVVKSFRLGTVGPGHYGFNHSDREQDFSSSRTEFDERAKKTANKSVNPDREPRPHPGHTPMTVEGKGVKRHMVRGHSSGLQFTYEEMLGNDNHWEFDSSLGILSFNTRSDIWAKMETSERSLILYQQYIAIKALELQLLPPTTRPQVFEFLQSELKSAMMFITTSTVLQPRKPKSEVGTKC